MSPFSLSKVRWSKKQSKLGLKPPKATLQHWPVWTTVAESESKVFAGSRSQKKDFVRVEKILPELGVKSRKIHTRFPVLHKNLIKL